MVVVGVKRAGGCVAEGVGLFVCSGGSDVVTGGCKRSTLLVERLVDALGSIAVFAERCKDVGRLLPLACRHQGNRLLVDGIGCAGGSIIVGTRSKEGGLRRHVITGGEVGFALLVVGFRDAAGGILIRTGLGEGGKRGVHIACGKASFALRIIRLENSFGGVAIRSGCGEGGGSCVPFAGSEVGFSLLVVQRGLAIGGISVRAGLGKGSDGTGNVTTGEESFGLLVVRLENAVGGIRIRTGLDEGGGSCVPLTGGEESFGLLVVRLENAGGSVAVRSGCGEGSGSGIPFAGGEVGFGHHIVRFLYADGRILVILNDTEGFDCFLPVAGLQQQFRLQIVGLLNVLGRRAVLISPGKRRSGTGVITGGEQLMSLTVIRLKHAGDGVAKADRLDESVRRLLPAFIFHQPFRLTVIRLENAVGGILVLAQRGEGSRRVSPAVIAHQPFGLTVIRLGNAFSGVLVIAGLLKGGGSISPLAVFQQILSLNVVRLKNTGGGIAVITGCGKGGRGVVPQSRLHACFSLGVVGFRNARSGVGVVTGQCEGGNRIIIAAGKQQLFAELIAAFEETVGSILVLTQSLIGRRSAHPHTLSKQLTGDQIGRFLPVLRVGDVIRDLVQRCLCACLVTGSKERVRLAIVRLQHAVGSIAIAHGLHEQAGRFIPFARIQFGFRLQIVRLEDPISGILVAACLGKRCGSGIPLTHGEEGFRLHVIRLENAGGGVLILAGLGEGSGGFRPFASGEVRLGLLIVQLSHARGGIGVTARLGKGRDGSVDVVLREEGFRLHVIRLENAGSGVLVLSGLGEGSGGFRPLACGKVRLGLLVVQLSHARGGIGVTARLGKGGDGSVDVVLREERFSLTVIRLKHTCSSVLVLAGLGEGGGSGVPFAGSKEGFCLQIVHLGNAGRCILVLAGLGEGGNSGVPFAGSKEGFCLPVVARLQLKRTVIIIAQSSEGGNCFVPFSGFLMRLALVVACNILTGKVGRIFVRAKADKFGVCPGMCTGALRFHRQLIPALVFHVGRDSIARRMQLVERTDIVSGFPFGNVVKENVQFAVQCADAAVAIRQRAERLKARHGLFSLAVLQHLIANSVEFRQQTGFIADIRAHKQPVNGLPKQIAARHAVERDALARQASEYKGIQRIVVGHFAVHQRHNPAIIAIKNKVRHLHDARPCIAVRRDRLVRAQCILIALLRFCLDTAVIRGKQRTIIEFAQHEQASDGIVILPRLRHGIRLRIQCVTAGVLIKGIQARKRLSCFDILPLHEQFLCLRIIRRSIRYTGRRHQHHQCQQHCTAAFHPTHHVYFPPLITYAWLQHPIRRLQMRHRLFNKFFHRDGLQAENFRFDTAVDGLQPFLADDGGSLHHAEDGADGRAVAVGIKAGFDGHADALAVITVAIQQAGGDDHRVGIGMTPVVNVVLVPFGMDAGKHIGRGDAAAPVVHDGHDVPEQARGGRNLRQTAKDDLLDIIADGGTGDHRGSPHLAVDTVLDMGNGRISPGHIGCFLGLAGIDIAEVVRTDLRAYPLAERILVDSGIRRQIAADEVAVRHTLSGKIRILALVAQPQLHDIVRDEITAALLNQFLIEDGVVGIVIRRGTIDQIGQRNRAHLEAPARLLLRRVILRGDVAVHREVVRALQQRMQLVRAHALDRLAQQAAADTAQPRTLDAVADGSGVNRRILPQRQVTQRADAFRIARLVVRIISAAREIHHHIADDIGKALAELAVGHIANALKQRAVRRNIDAFLIALAVFNHNIPCIVLILRKLFALRKHLACSIQSGILIIHLYRPPFSLLYMMTYPVATKNRACIIKDTDAICITD